MRYAIAFIFLAFLASCTSQARTQTQTRTVGVQAGQEVNISTTSTTLASETSGVDVAALVSAAVQASQGKILGALEAIKPQPLPNFPSVEQISSAVSTSMPKPGTDWGTVGASGLATLMATIYAMMQRKEKKTIELDRDKTYDDYIEVCKKTPPESLKG
jgi:hypothetical protein